MSPSNPTGPREWILLVLIPTSVPKPYLVPSAKRVDAFQYTPAESTAAMKRSACSADAVRMQSVWWEPRVLMWAMASSSEDTVLTASVSDRNSVEKSASVASANVRLGVPARAALLWGSQRSSTPLAARAVATVGRR